jgi:hypothetical protein
MRALDTSKFVRLNVFAALVLALIPGMASADVTYDITLTGSPEAGSGFFTINTPFPATVPSEDSYTPGGSPYDLLALSFTIDGNTFTLNDKNPSSTPSVVSLNGSFFDIIYSGTLPGGLSLMVNDPFYVFDDLNDSGVDTTGTFTAALAPSAVPEPMSIILFGTVLVGLTVFLRKRLFGRPS